AGNSTTSHAFTTPQRPHGTCWPWQCKHEADQGREINRASLRAATDRVPELCAWGDLHVQHANPAADHHAPGSHQQRGPGHNPVLHRECDGYDAIWMVAD